MRDARYNEDENRIQRRMQITERRVLRRDNESERVRLEYEKMRI